MVISNNHITYQASNRIKSLLKPLTQIADIHYFCYGVNFPDGSGFTLLTHPDFYDAWFEKEFPMHGFYLENGWHSWRGNLPQEELSEAQRLNIAHGVGIINKTNEKTEIFQFATTPENEKIFDFYLNNKHLLKKFSNYFLIEAKDLTKVANNQRIMPPPTMRARDTFNISSQDKKKDILNDLINSINYPHNSLSEREEKCYQLLIQGYSHTEIGKIFNLSSKTIDAYISRIKIKLNCENKVELIQSANNSGMVEFFFNDQNAK